MSTGKSSAAETVGIVLRQLLQSTVLFISRQGIYENIDLKPQNLLGVFLPFPKRCHSRGLRKPLPSQSFYKVFSPRASLCVWILSSPVLDFFLALYTLLILAVAKQLHYFSLESGSLSLFSNGLLGNGSFKKNMVWEAKAIGNISPPI